jgi:hypothetical protein
MVLAYSPRLEIHFSNAATGTNSSCTEANRTISNFTANQSNRNDHTAHSADFSQHSEHKYNSTLDLCTWMGNILELSVKLLKEGMTAPSLAETGDETRNWAHKKYKGVEQAAKLYFGPKLRVK